MKSENYWLVVLLAFFALSGCNFPANQDLPTPFPSEYIPTVIAMTVEAQRVKVTPLYSPSSTPTSTPFLEEVTNREIETQGTPEPTNTPIPPASEPVEDISQSFDTPVPPPEVPYGTIQILNPGPASRLTSPFLFKSYLLPGENGNLQVELLGEDGRVLVREIKAFSVPRGARVTTAIEISYEISAVAEAGRIQASVVDEYGRTSALESVDVLLLSLGEADQNPPGDLLESIVIQEPKPNALIQGGMLRVSGLARTRSDQSLRIELQTKEGKIVGTRQVAVDRPEPSQYGTFAIDVPYQVTAPSQVRLAVWEPGDKIPGIVHLSSLEVLLSP